MPFIPIDTFPYLPRRPAGDHGRAPDPYNELWIRAKTIDGYPENEWTFPAFVRRAQALDGFHPFLFYEEASTWDDAWRIVDYIHLLSEGGIHEELCPLISIGMKFYDSGFRALDGRLPLPSPVDPFRGRHSVMVTGGLKSQGRDSSESDLLIFRNSWGPEWGTRGYGYISREYFDVAVESVTINWPGEIGFVPNKRKALERLRRLSGPRYVHAVGEAWLSPNRCVLEMRNVLDKAHELWHWRVYSLVSGREVVVIQLHNLIRAIGRVHVSLDDTNASIDELFVWPALRRRGYGRVLESFAAGLAQQEGCKRIVAHLREADAQPRQYEISRAFGSALGYTWTGLVTTRPNTFGVATRLIDETEGVQSLDCV